MPGAVADRPTPRTMAGLLITLGGAGLLAVVAAYQDLYSAVEQTFVGRSAFSVAAGGDYHVTDGPALARLTYVIGARTVAELPHAVATGK